MLDAFVDNELDRSEKEQVLAHVQSCDNCKRQVKEIEALKTTLSGLPRRKMTIDLADKFDQVPTKGLEAASTESVNVIAIRGRRRWIVGAASAAAVVVIAIAGSIVSKGGGEQVANSNLPTSSIHMVQSVAQRTSDPDNIAKNGVSAENKNALAGSQLLKVDLSKQSGSGTDVEDPQAIKSGSDQKIAAHRQSRPGAETTAAGTLAKTGGAHLSEDMAQNGSHNTTVVFHDENSKTNITGTQKNRSASSELLALYEEDDGIGSDIGMTTDEDGLYAIKL
jgi:hypothetical protein